MEVQWAEPEPDRMKKENRIGTVKEMHKIETKRRQ
jgi:hypothetical protein